MLRVCCKPRPAGAVARLGDPAQLDPRTLEDRYGEVDDEVAVDLAEMDIQSRRLDRLLSDLLQYARLGANDNLAVDAEPAELIAEAANLSGVPYGFEVRVHEELRLSAAFLRSFRR